MHFFITICALAVNIIITEEDNYDDSYTFREYWDEILQEKHTTVPGSGVTKF